MLYSVNSSTALVAALKGASAGDTISLAAGSYSAVTLSGFHFASDVRITSADPANTAAIANLTVKDSSGLSFDHVQFTTAGSYALTISNSSDIHVDHVSVHGSIDGDGTNDAGNGAFISQSSDVTISNSEFQELKNGIVHGATQGLQITGDYFHNIRVDGVHGSAATDMKIIGNYFTKFQNMAGDHSDAIQFHTIAESTPTSGVTIANNVIVSGGASQMQGVFIADEVGTVPYSNIVISGNLIANSNYQGIFVAHAYGVWVAENTVASPAGENSWIYVKSGDYVNLQNNVVMQNGSKDILLGDIPNLTQSNNTHQAAFSNGEAALVQAWADGHGEATSLLANFSLNILTHGYVDTGSPVTTTPAIPTLPTVPTVPTVPDIPNIPNIPFIPFTPFSPVFINLPNTEGLMNGGFFL